MHERPHLVIWPIPPRELEKLIALLVRKTPADFASGIAYDDGIGPDGACDNRVCRHYGPMTDGYAREDPRLPPHPHVGPNNNISARRWVTIRERAR
jgi:hypothetical protein